MSAYNIKNDLIEVVMGSNFLNLPGEIRNQIYELLLVVPAIPDSHALGQTPRVHPSILAVCRQTYHEAIKILYGSNTFIAHNSLLSSLPQLRRWLGPVKSPSLISLITRFYIFIRLECDPRFTALEAHAAFSGAELLTIEVSQSQFRGSDHRVLKLFEDIRGVKKARVFGSVSGFREYAAWLERAMMSPAGSKLLMLEEAPISVRLVALDCE